MTSLPEHQSLLDQKRGIKLSVTNFLYHGDEYLFQSRRPNAVINPGQLNGIGGKLDPGETYVACALRETEEETGYTVSLADVVFCGIIHFAGGFADDWLTCFYKVRVPHKDIPVGSTTREGRLLWIHKDDVLHRNNLVDDLYYIFEDIVSGTDVFFMTAVVAPDTERIIHHSIQRLAR